MGDFLAGKYLLEDCLGIGGMGEVYRATNVSLGRKVAIKLLAPEFAGNEADVLRFLREARAAAAVRHANVVDVFDVARDDDGTPFIVQELLAGEDLEKYLLRRGGRISPTETLEIMVPVADAVAAAHARDVVHRDLKPANIFLAREGNKIVPKVLDFGACLFPTIGERSAKEARLLIGTPHYMAPEQIVKKQEIDARCDVWALGVILYEMLVGETPFEAETADEVLDRVVKQGVPPLRLRAPDAPAAVEALIARCTKPERHERLADAGVVRGEMQRVRDMIRGHVAKASLETLTEVPVTPLPVAKKPALMTLNAPGDELDDAPPLPASVKFRAPEGGIELDMPFEARVDSSLPPVLDPRAFAPQEAPLPSRDPSPMPARRDPTPPPQRALRDPTPPPQRALRDPTPMPARWDPTPMPARRDPSPMPARRDPTPPPQRALRDPTPMPARRDPTPMPMTPRDPTPMPARHPSPHPDPLDLSSAPPLDIQLPPASPLDLSSAPPLDIQLPPVSVDAPASPRPETAPLGPPPVKLAPARPRGAWTPASTGAFTAAILGPALVLYLPFAFASFAAPIGHALRGDSTLASGVLTVVALLTAAGLGAKTFLGERERWTTIACAASVLVGIVMIIVTSSASEAAELGVPSTVGGLSTFVAPLPALALAIGAVLRAREAWFDPYSRSDAVRNAALGAVMVAVALVLSPIGAIRVVARLHG